MLPVNEPFFLYIHIPYCVSKCPYCDFNSHVVPKIPEKEYSEALLKELDFYASSVNWQGRKLQSIFFGGGTPSTFRPTSIGKILEKTESFFPFEEEIEITLEANPGTADSGNFSGYRSCGVNRISIGAQSFQPHVLKFLGRVHSSDETRRALKMVREAGFENFNLDLMYANQGQSLADLKSDLNEALKFQPPHLSAYNLTLEEGTPFYREYLVGSIRNLPEDDEIAMAECIEETLLPSGLERYEISNYAMPGKYSRHNVNYWQGGDYLGVGAGAHSFRRIQDNGVYGRRWHNERNPARYMEMVDQDGKATAMEEKIDVHMAAGEFMFMGLRMLQGISVNDFSGRFGPPPKDLYPRISDLLEEGLMEEKADKLRLTPSGLLVANSIFVSFV
jgi:oxygen-independent coproporphyrinogen-3 oxidase